MSRRTVVDALADVPAQPGHEDRRDHPDDPPQQDYTESPGQYEHTEQQEYRGQYEYTEQQQHAGQQGYAGVPEYIGRERHSRRPLPRLLRWAIAIAITAIGGLVWQTSDAPQPVPLAYLGARYSSHLECTDDCATWRGTETITIELPEQPSALDALSDRLPVEGWSPTPTLIQVSEKTRPLTFTRPVTWPQAPTPHGWPPSVTHRIPIPAEVKGDVPLLELAKERPEDRSALTFLASQVDDNKVPVTLRPRPGSTVTLRFPRLSVEATTPASEARAITGGREQRVIDVSDPNTYDAGAVTVDVLASGLREPTMAMIVSFRHTAWIWLLLLAVLGIAGAAARRRLDAILDALKFGKAETTPETNPPRTRKKRESRRRRRKRRRRGGVPKGNTGAS